jgi:hypothetical protein
MILAIDSCPTCYPANKQAHLNFEPGHLNWPAPPHLWKDLNKTGLNGATMLALPPLYMLNEGKKKVICFFLKKFV